MLDQNVAKKRSPKEYSTWFGCPVRPSPEYPDRVFLVQSSVGLNALEACHEDLYWAAKIRIDGFVGQAVSRSRSDARSKAERMLLEAMSKDPKGLLWINALNLFVILNPVLVTGGSSSCQTLN